MVTLITEKLQNQSLDDLARSSYDAGPYSAEKLGKGGYLFPLETHGDRRPWTVLSGGQPVGSQEHLVDVGSPPCTPEPGRRLGLPRSRSQPCVLPGRRGRLKRRREGDARWPRPSLDFLKMTRTLKNSKSLCSLDYEDEDEDDPGVKTAVSSPCDPHGLMGLVASGSSPLSTCPGPHPASPGPWASGEPAAGEGGSSGDPSDWDSAGEEGVFPLDRSELDLEQIENN